MHVDDFIDHYKSNAYARWVFTIFRLPAALAGAVAPWSKQFRLYCDYQGKRWRVIGASRMGDVWLTSKLEASGDGFPYEQRVDVAECSNFTDTAQ